MQPSMETFNNDNGFASAQRAHASAFGHKMSLLSHVLMPPTVVFHVADLMRAVTLAQPQILSKIWATDASMPSINSQMRRTRELPSNDDSMEVMVKKD